MVVHIVGQHQRELAQRFSRSAEHRFNDQRSWSLLESGEPVLADTPPTWLRADVQQLIPAGDSTLVIAAVTRIHCDDRDGVTPAPPLVYHNGAFLATSPLPAVST